MRGSALLFDTSRVVGASLVVGSLLLGVSGCDGDSTDNILEVGVETDAQLLVDPGVGAGVYVEYYAGGDWYVFTSCDTSQSGYGCQFDIDLYVPKGARLRNVRGYDLEYVDDDLVTYDNSIAFSTWTYDDFDGVSFSTDPGEPVRIDFWLDGYVQPEVLFWNEGGAVQSTAPSVPLDMQPESP